MQASIVLQEQFVAVTKAFAAAKFAEQTQSALCLETAATAHALANVLLLLKLKSIVVVAVGMGQSLANWFDA